jgi:hypothetical protein
VKKLSFCITIFTYLNTSAQLPSKDIVNPKGQWYFGAEIGSNRIASLNLGESRQTFQGGILAEYYFARHWSLSGKIKYFETGVSYFERAIKSSGSFAGFFGSSGRPSYSGNFSGAQIAIPLCIKWEFRFRKNFAGSLKIGYNQIFETEGNGTYKSDDKILNLENDKIYGGTVLGLGFNYFLNQNLAIYIDFEGYTGGSVKGYGQRKSYTTENSLTNFGVKYNFKK